MYTIEEIANRNLSDPNGERTGKSLLSDSLKLENLSKHDVCETPMISRKQFLIGSGITLASLILPFNFKPYETIKLTEIFRNDIFANDQLWFLKEPFKKKLYSGIKIPFTKKHGYWYDRDHDHSLPIKREYTTQEIGDFFNLSQSHLNEYPSLYDTTGENGDPVYFFWNKDDNTIQLSYMRSAI